MAPQPGGSEDVVPDKLLNKHAQEQYNRATYRKVRRGDFGHIDLPLSSYSLIGTFEDLFLQILSFVMTVTFTVAYITGLFSEPIALLILWMLVGYRFYKLAYPTPQIEE